MKHQLFKTVVWLHLDISKFIDSLRREPLSFNFNFKFFAAHKILTTFKNFRKQNFQSPCNLCLRSVHPRNNRIRCVFHVRRPRGVHIPNAFVPGTVPIFVLDAKFAKMSSAHAQLSYESLSAVCSLSSPLFSWWSWNVGCREHFLKAWETCCLRPKLSAQSPNVN